jgi:hypothetical protein
MNDPTRLGDPRSNSPEDLKRLIQAGQSDVPAKERLRGVADRLGFGLGAAGASGAKGAAGVLGSTAAKTGVLAVLVLGAGAGTLAVSHLARAPSTTILAPNRTDESARPRLEAKVALRPSSAESPPGSALPPTMATTPIVRSPPSTVTPIGGQNGKIATASVSASNDTEFSLLEQAQRALRSDPQRALDLTDRDIQLYPTGPLAQEREVIAIEALVQRGRRDEARARAARFFEAFPGSAHGPRIASMLDLDAGVHNP